MSGFEIAGVVLGAFPIIISGLQGYAQGCEAVGGQLLQHTFSIFGDLK